MNPVVFMYSIIPIEWYSTTMYKNIQKLYTTANGFRQEYIPDHDMTCLYTKTARHIIVVSLGLPDPSSRSIEVG